MGDSSTRGSRSLTGVWQGIYSYPASALPTVPFTATLLQAGSSLSGSIHEQCTIGGRGDETLYFSLSGSRHGMAVDFAKTFQGTSPYYGTILYAGSVNAEATEIEGTWTIPGQWSGRFLMTRSGDQPQAAAKREGAKSPLGVR